MPVKRHPSRPNGTDYECSHLLRFINRLIPGAKGPASTYHTMTLLGHASHIHRLLWCERLTSLHPLPYFTVFPVTDATTAIGFTSMHGCVHVAKHNCYIVCRHMAVIIWPKKSDAGMLDLEWTWLYAKKTTAMMCPGMTHNPSLQLPCGTSSRHMAMYSSAPARISSGSQLTLICAVNPSIGSPSSAADQESYWPATDCALVEGIHTYHNCKHLLKNF